MSSFVISTILQVVVALGLLNVWLVRAQNSTAYRGVLMIGALTMHAKVKDPLTKSVPALLVLLMVVAIILLH
jgi:hypothetical protein